MSHAHKRHQLYFSINVQSFIFFNSYWKERKQILYQESSNWASSSRSLGSNSYCWLDSLWLPVERFPRFVSLSANKRSSSSLNFTNVLHENDNLTKSTNNKTSQIIIKNINNLPRNELEEFLKKSGATNIQSGDIDNSLIVTYSSKSDVNKIQKNGLTFKDRNLDISFNEDPSLNISNKKRTLSETIEDELLETANNDDNDEPELKRRNQNQTSDVDENEEVGDEEDRLLADNETKRTNLSTGSHDESNQQYDFEPNDLDDEVQLLDSWHSICFLLFFSIGIKKKTLNIYWKIQLVSFVRVTFFCFFFSSACACFSFFFLSILRL